MKSRILKLLAIPALAICVFMTACGASDVARTLNLIVAGVDIALPLVTVSGVVPAPVAALVTHYLTTVSTAVTQAAPELDSADSSAQKADKIAQIFATVVLPDIPGLTADQLVKIQSVDAAVHAFLNALGVVPGHAVASARAAKAPHISLSAQDHAKLAEIHAHAAAQVAALAK